MRYPAPSQRPPRLAVILVALLAAIPALALQSQPADTPAASPAQPPPAAGQSNSTPANPTQSAPRQSASPTFAMRPPRPVDPSLRAARDFPPPRPTDAVLLDIDAIPSRMRVATDDRSTWRPVRLYNEELQHERINLISELEESGYKGARLPALLHQKLMDIRDVWSRQHGPIDGYNRLRYEIVARHPDTPAAIEARAEILLEAVQFISINELRVHPDDYEKLAAVEIQRKDDDLAGLVILEALASEDAASPLHEKWHDWMAANLGPKSMGKRHVLRERAFGHPIRLQGDGLDGAKIDTADWTGQVVLVDFWGTWCIPCMEAMPELNRLETKYRDRGLRIVGVLSDYQLDKATRWLKANEYGWPQLVDRTLTRETYDQHPIAVQYAIGGFPTLWIIDRRGVLRETGDRDNLEEQVVRFLDDPSPHAK